MLYACKSPTGAKRAHRSGKVPAGFSNLAVAARGLNTGSATGRCLGIVKDSEEARVEGVAGYVL